MIESQFPIRIPRCFDSHIHFMGTAQVHLGLQLFNVEKLDDFRRLNPLPQHYRGDWLIGFGWDQQKIKEYIASHEENTWPKAKDLDSYFNCPVAFTRADGHVLWLNSEGLRRLGLDRPNVPDPKGGKILRDSNGFPTGILFDSAKVQADLQIPTFTFDQLKDQAFYSCEHFHRQGFTHVRDMTSDSKTFQVIQELVHEKKWKLFYSAYVVCEGVSDWDRCWNEILNCKKFATPYSKVLGVKVFVDGALGSEGAAISGEYPNGNRGTLSWPKEEIQAIAKKVGKKKMELAVHTIGDRAVDWMADLLLEISSGDRPSVHFEHVQVLQDKTLPKLKELNAKVAMQPSHFLSDRAWLRQKLGSLYQDCFPWKKLTDFGIEVSFGSDSPIEPSRLDLTKDGLLESEKAGIPRWNQDWWRGHSHPDTTWGANCYTEIDRNGQIHTHFKPVEI